MLKADISQFFPSIDHAVLERLLARHIACRRTLELCRTIMASGDGILASEYTMHYFPGDDLFAALRPRGLPIGNLTSQFWANIYLNGIDTLIQRELRLPHVRYCDDMLIFADTKAVLHTALAALHAHAADLRLTLHPLKTRIYTADEGIDFVGYRLFYEHRRLRRSNVRLFVRRLRRQQRAYRAGQLTGARLQASIRSWVAHAQHADTYRLRSRLLRAHPFAPPERRS